MINKILPFLFILILCSMQVMPVMAANGPENLTAIFDVDHVHLDWDDIPNATNYTVCQALPSTLWTDETPVFDGIIDQVFWDDAHRAVAFSPNPPYEDAYDIFMSLRNETTVFFVADTQDNDIHSDDDTVAVYIDYDRDGLTSSIDKKYEIEEDGTVNRYRWNGVSWIGQPGSSAIGMTSGAGSSEPIYEMWVPRSEIGFGNDTVYDILVERSSDDIAEVFTYQPRTATPLNTIGWAPLYNVASCDEAAYNITVTYTSDVEISDLDAFDWYRFGVFAFVDNVATTKTVISGITLPAQEFVVDGYVYEEFTGEPVRNAVVALTDTMTVAATETDQNGYFSIGHIINDTYTADTSKLGYSTGSKTFTVSGENETVILFMTTMGENKIPLSLFIFLALIDIGCIAFSFVSFDRTSITQIFGSFIATIVSFMLSKMAVNGQLVESFEFASVIQNAAIGYLFQYVAIIMVIITLLRAVLYVLERYQESEI